MCLAELLDFEMPAVCCSVPGFKRKHVSINVMTRLFRISRLAALAAQVLGGAVREVSGNAHQLTRKERECNLTFAMCLILLPYASTTELADQPHKPHNSSSCSCCVLG